MYIYIFIHTHTHTHTQTSTTKLALILLLGRSPQRVSVIFSLLFPYQFCSGLLCSFTIYVQCGRANTLSSLLFFRMPLQFVHFQVRFYVFLTCNKKFTISIFIGTKLFFNLNLEKINTKFREIFHLFTFFYEPHWFKAF